MSKQSLMQKLFTLFIGESALIECAYPDHVKIMRNLGARQSGRMPAGMENRRFSSRLYTCIAATNPQDIIYIVKITRQEDRAP